jgi:hypothetical protein
MTFTELSQRLQLAEGSKHNSWSAWAEEPPFAPEDDPETTRHQRFGFTVCWPISNTYPCPSEEELSAVIIPQE